MAAQFIDGNPGLVDGLGLWASWPGADIADQDLVVPTLWGTLDRAAASNTSP
jgi:hypothetical protein